MSVEQRERGQQDKEGIFTQFLCLEAKRIHELDRGFVDDLADYLDQSFC